MSSPAEEINSKSAPIDTNQFSEVNDDLTVELEGTQISDSDQTDEIDLSLVIADPLADTSSDKTAVIVNQHATEPQDSKFQIHYSLFRDTLPVVIVFHCSGKISKPNCLILHNTFKICASKNLQFIVFDMSEVTAVETDVWSYFSSKVQKLQKQNGIVLFSGIRSEVLSETSDFHKFNICHCETIDVSLTIIKNLVLEHEKVAYFPEFIGKEPSFARNEPQDIAFLLNTVNALNNEAVNFRNPQIDDSMSIDFSVYREPTANSASSITKNFSSKDTDALVNLNASDITYVESNSTENPVITGQNVIAKDMEMKDQFMNQSSIKKTGDSAIKQTPLRINNIQSGKTVSIEDKIDIIISQNGPCSFGKIKKLLQSSNFGSVKIGSFALMRILKEMNLDSNKKRIRFYRSC